MKKLRRKIFWSIELSAMGILLVIILAFNVMNWMQMQNQEWKVLQKAVLYSEWYDSGSSDLSGLNADSRGEHGSTGKGKDMAVIAGAVSSGEISLLQTKTNGSVLDQSGFAAKMSASARRSLIASILKEGTDSGRTGGVLYVMQKYDGTCYIACMKDDVLMQEVLIHAGISSAAFAAAALVFALLARFLARRISRPVEETIQTQKQFIADASHELKTPVAVINANISVLESEVGPNKWMGYIKEEGSRLNDLVADLLQLSRIDYEEERGKTAAAFMFSLSDVLMETALPFESVAFERGISYGVEIPEEAAAYGNADDVRHIAGILLDNALRNTEEGGRAECVLDSSADQGKAGKTVRFSVWNTGQKIPEEELPHLFDRFYKTDKARTYKEKNFGLGLAIAKSLTERNGGKISVSSEAYHGNGGTVKNHGDIGVCRKADADFIISDAMTEDMTNPVPGAAADSMAEDSAADAVPGPVTDFIADSVTDHVTYRTVFTVTLPAEKSNKRKT